MSLNKNGEKSYFSIISNLTSNINDYFARKDWKKIEENRC